MTANLGHTELKALRNEAIRQLIAGIKLAYDTNSVPNAVCDALHSIIKKESELIREIEKLKDTIHTFKYKESLSVWNDVFYG